MARTLKSTGPAANAVWIMAVDDDDSTIKLWTTPGASTGWTSGSGITLGGSSPPSVTTGKTWNSESLPMVHFGANSLLTITTPGTVSSPLCVFMVVKDFNAQADSYIVRGSATSGGSADGSGPSVSFNGTPLLVMRLVDAGTALSLTTHSWAANEDVSWFLHDLSSGDNLTYLAAEGVALSGVDYTTTDPSANLSSVYAKFIGSGTTPSWSGDIVAMGLMSAAISESDAAAIHSDPFGTLFEASGGGGSSAPKLSGLTSSPLINGRCIA